MSNAFLDINDYPVDHIWKGRDGIHVGLVYKQVWDDDYVVRGWKTTASLNDSEIIASTRETGHRINTSVLVHDVLDHMFSGFCISGHRSEAMALRQLSMRTGLDANPDYEQMVREDILLGRVNGETLWDFLPAELLIFLDKDDRSAGKEMMDLLQKKVGEKELVEILIRRFIVLGEAGEKHAESSWKNLGLNSALKAGIGEAMQRILLLADNWIEKKQCESARAEYIVANRFCSLTVRSNDSSQCNNMFHTVVTAS